MTLGSYHIVNYYSDSCNSDEKNRIEMLLPLIEWFQKTSMGVAIELRVCLLMKKNYP